MKPYLRYLSRGTSSVLVAVAIVVFVWWKSGPDHYDADLARFLVPLAATMGMLGGLEKLQVRATPFELGLPLSGRTLVGARLAVYTMHGLACIGLPTAASLLLVPAADRATVLATGVRLAPVVPAALLLLGAVEPGRARLPGVWRLAAILIGGVGALFAAAAWPSVWLPALMTGVAVVAGASLWRRLPVSLEYGAPEEAHPWRPRWSPSIDGPWRFVVRHTVLRWEFAALVPVFAMLFWAASGIGVLIFVPFVWYVIGALMRDWDKRIRFLSHLPVAPRRLCPFVILPPFAVIGAATVLGASFRSEPPDPGSGQALAVLQTGLWYLVLAPRLRRVWIWRRRSVWGALGAALFWWVWVGGVLYAVLRAPGVAAADRALRAAFPEFAAPFAGVFGWIAAAAFLGLAYAALARRFARAEQASAA